MTETWKKFLRDELKKEADEIEAEVLKDDSLNDVKPTPEMYQALMEKLQEMDSSKEAKDEEDRYSRLTEEEINFIRIGLKAKESGAKIVYKRKRKKRIAFLCAAVLAVLVVGTGVTSVGGPQYLVDVITQKLGDREMVHVDSKDKTLKSGESKEEKAYIQIEEELGFTVIRMDYAPHGTKFVDSDINTQVQKATLFFEMGDKTFMYQIKSIYSTGKFSLEYEDNQKSLYDLIVQDKNIELKEYVVDGSDIPMMSAQFEVDDIQYFLSGQIKKDEFEKIVKNLHFF